MLVRGYLETDCLPSGISKAGHADEFGKRLDPFDPASNTRERIETKPAFMAQRDIWKARDVGERRAFQREPATGAEVVLEDSENATGPLARRLHVDCVTEEIMQAASFGPRAISFSATMSRLSQDTGLGRSSLYHHFRQGKEAMARESLTLVEELFEHELFPLLEGNDPPTARLRRFATRLGEYYEGGRVGCLLGAFSLQDSPASVAEYTRALFERWINALQAIYSEIGISSEPARTRAAQAVAAVQGSLLLSAATGDEAHLRHALKRMCEFGERP